MESQTINFYSVNENFGEFSNFAPYPIKLKGKVWTTTEHYYQAQKFKGTSYENKIRKAATPKQAAQLGRSRKLQLRPDWEKVKNSVMFDAVRAKFTQHKDLKELLLSTGDAKIIEHTVKDNYWGDGGNGNGKNMLGKILMKIRKELE